MNPSVPNPSSLSEEFSVFSLDTFFCALTYYMCVCVWSHSVVSDSLRPCGLHPARLLCPWDSPGKNTGVGCHFLLQGIFPTQGSNLGLLRCRQTLYPLSHQGSHLLYVCIWKYIEVLACFSPFSFSLSVSSSTFFLKTEVAGCSATFFSTLPFKV